MPIQHLPPSSQQRLCSTQALLDPVSVVKELVENSIDARATAIFVEISPNAVDVIRVRDNGHGVPAEDRELLCKANCTSKIRAIHDLRRLGGSSLGFRGEALSGIAELSGGLEVWTRVEGDVVGVGMEIGRDGEVLSQTSVSHPVGTTVRISDFFSNVPVRKRMAEKDARKHIKSLEKLFSAFALTRPNIRLSFKVLNLKAKHHCLNYVPKFGGGTVEDVVFKIISRACASQCLWKTEEIDGYQFQGFLPRFGAIGRDISSLGQYLSIDSRPVVTTRGTLKQIVKMFKEAIQRTGPGLENTNDPFLSLNIGCPSGHYDPNVEPLKNDIIFEDEPKLLAAVRKFFQLAYPGQDDTASSVLHFTSDDQWGQTIDAKTGSSILQPNVVGELQENDHQDVIEIPSSPSELSDYIDQALENCREPVEIRNQSHDLSGGMCDGEDDGLPPYPLLRHHVFLSEEEELREASRNIEISNPWTIARMNAPVRNAFANSPKDTEREMTPKRHPRKPSSAVEFSSSPTDLNQGGGKHSRLNLMSLGSRPGQIDRQRLTEQQLPTPLPSSSSPARNSAPKPFSRISNTPQERPRKRSSPGVMKPFVAPAKMNNTVEKRSNSTHSKKDSSLDHIHQREDIRGFPSSLQIPPSLNARMTGQYAPEPMRKAYSFGPGVHRVRKSTFQGLEKASEPKENSRLGHKSDDKEDPTLHLEHRQPVIDPTILDFFNLTNTNLITSSSPLHNANLPKGNIQMSVSSSFINELFWKIEPARNHLRWESLPNYPHEGNLTDSSEDMKLNWAKRSALLLKSKYRVEGIENLIKNGLIDEFLTN